MGGSEILFYICVHWLCSKAGVCKLYMELLLVSYKQEKSGYFKQGISVFETSDQTARNVTNLFILLCGDLGYQSL